MGSSLKIPKKKKKKKRTNKDLTPSESRYGRILRYYQKNKTPQTHKFVQKFSYRNLIDI